MVIDGHSAPSNCTGGYASTYTTCLLGVTFWLDQGATIGIGNKASVLLKPSRPPSRREDPNDGFFAIYAPTGSAGGLYVSNDGTTLANDRHLLHPSGAVNIGREVR